LGNLDNLGNMYRNPSLILKFVRYVIFKTQDAIVKKIPI